ncbi:hypothetical protein Pmani_026729 [Petrolisthes manimaculis]|uniref:Uncharacterized protein n=1 Tax=Petrolisthes manimaculis TaxID=1843537 RepID=A0AAE1TXJ8_9EUCA|nr:hypothetical protein Pmani_026729 [Petrolisthes manimaculis]
MTNCVGGNGESSRGGGGSLAEVKSCIWIAYSRVAWMIWEEMVGVRKGESGRARREALQKNTLVNNIFFFRPEQLGTRVEATAAGELWGEGGRKRGSGKANSIYPKTRCQTLNVSQKIELHVPVPDRRAPTNSS